MPDVQRLFREYIRLDRKRQRSTLTQREYERWSALKQQLNATFSPSARPDAVDRRQSVRVPVKLEVHFQSQGALKRSLLTNLSRGGVFITTDSPAPIGTRITLRIVVDESGTAIEVSGEVVSHNVGRGFRHEGAGMGVRFADLKPKAAVALDRLYEGALGSDE